MKNCRKKVIRIAAVSAIITGAVAIGLSIPAKAPAETALKPLYKGTVYSAGRGGHMVFTNITIDPNRDMISGSTVGRLPMPNNEQADAIQMSKDEKYLFYPTWDQSMMYTIDIQDKTHPKVAAENKIFDGPTKHCGSQIAADGSMYMSSMALGDVHKFDVTDPLKPKLMDRNYKSTYLCNVQTVGDGSKIITTDMKDHNLYLYDTKSGERLKTLKPGGDEFLHRGQLSPDGKTLYQASTGSLGDGVHNGRVYAIDTKSLEVKDTFILGANYDAHDATTTPDGKYLIVAARRTPQPEFKDSEYIVVNLETKKPIGSISMCAGCHNANEVSPAITKGREVFICGIQIAWNK